MTIIVRGVSTKKELKEHPERARFEDPSIHFPLNAGLPFSISYLGLSGKTITVTNHPKRSWFAQVSYHNYKAQIS